MKQFVIRVRSEHEQLLKRIEALESFINDNFEFGNLAEEPKKLLKIQLQAMKTYSECLSARIEYYAD